MIVQPRRFALCHQVSADFPGTVEQQLALRKALHAEFGSLFAKLIHRFAVAFKLKYRPDRSYVVWEFRDIEGYAALAGAVSVTLDADITPPYINDTVRHEFGHLVDKHLLIPEDRMWFMETHPTPTATDWAHGYKEPWADHVMTWINTAGQVHSDLTSILVPS